MSAAGRYVLDLECDYHKPLLGTHEPITGKQQFLGQTEGDTKKAARAAGWLVGKNVYTKSGRRIGGYAVCPRCAIKETSQ